MIQELVGVEFSAAAVLRKCYLIRILEVLWHVAACKLVVKECQKHILSLHSSGIGFHDLLQIPVIATHHIFLYGFKVSLRHG